MMVAALQSTERSIEVGRSALLLLPPSQRFKTISYGPWPSLSRLLSMKAVRHPTKKNSDNQVHGAFKTNAKKDAATSTPRTRIGKFGSVDTRVRDRQIAIALWLSSRRALEMIRVRFGWMGSCSSLDMRPTALCSAQLESSAPQAVSGGPHLRCLSNATLGNVAILCRSISIEHWFSISVSPP
jgi:hypothetical protein